MTAINYLASFLESLKISHPKYFALVQAGLLAVFIFLEINPALALEYIPAHVLDWIQIGLATLGFSISSGTTKYLPAEHKKVQEIEMKNAGELDPEKYKL